jgi:putative endonuclease
MDITMKQPCVYIITNKPNGTLYIGVTTNLANRLEQHKTKAVSGFSAKYNLSRLVYFEQLDEIEEAIKREKQLKNWHRQWKVNLIEKMNPNWDDLSYLLSP